MCFLSFPLFFLFSCPAPFPHQPQTGLNSSATSIANSTSCEGELRLGDRVLVVGQRIGTIKFFGTTNFAPGYWYGIELEKPHGKNDGSVGGVQYFSCSPRYGIFAPPSRVQRVTDSLDTLSEISSNKQNHSYPGKITQFYIPNH